MHITAPFIPLRISSNGTFHRQINPFEFNEHAILMEANRVLYKNIVNRHECTLRKSTSSVYECVCSYFVIYFGFVFVIVMNQSAQKRLFTVKVLKAFLFSWSIFVFHNTIITTVITFIENR